MTGKKGFGLIVSIFVILLFSLLSIIAASMFSTDIQISIDSLFSTQAFYLAEAARSHRLYLLSLGKTEDSHVIIESDKPGQSMSYESIYLPEESSGSNAVYECIGHKNDVLRRLRCTFEVDVSDDPFGFAIRCGEGLALAETNSPPDIDGNSNYRWPPKNTSFNTNAFLDKYGSQIYSIDSDDTILTDLNNSNSKDNKISGIFYAYDTPVYIGPSKGIVKKLKIDGSIVAPTQGITIRNVEDLTIRPRAGTNLPALIGSKIVVNASVIPDCTIKIEGGIFSLTIPSDPTGESSGKIEIHVGNGIIDLRGITYAQSPDLNQAILLTDFSSPNKMFSSQGTFLARGQIAIDNSSKDYIRFQFTPDEINRNLVGFPPGIFLDEAAVRLVNWKEAF